MRQRKRSFLFIAAALASLLPAQASAESAGYLTDRGVAFYYALFPAEMIRGREQQEPEATMHGGPPRSRHAYHLMVALFDAATSRRITDAEVTAKVTEVGLAGQEKKLESMAVAGAVTYGNYFTLAPNTNYRIRVTVRTPSSAEPARIEFPFKHEREARGLRNKRDKPAGK
ncbi:hypothetical protein [Methylocystis hirsuta]|uniref:DUF4426 domain-containing protein n=1 Tax=Methylocystis hirsuta TaxID=369798 RepID=A0A3M9XKM6_9HYPH|nr:hypothetical protein [Methylocystis hirsuta]RNJ48192.1 hypothetical protein D1O30_20530 [Methylocystis hirsuta]